LAARIKRGIYGKWKFVNFHHNVKKKELGKKKGTRA